MIADYAETLSRDVIAQRSRVAGLRKRYDNYLDGGQHDWAAVTRGTINRAEAKLEGMEYALALAEGYVSEYLDDLERHYG